MFIEHTKQLSEWNHPEYSDSCIHIHSISLGTGLYTRELF